MGRAKRGALWLAPWLLAPAALVALVALALALRSGTQAARRTGRRPRLVFGPVPIISIKYMSEALRRAGYEARSYVYAVYPINSRDDFDHCLADVPDGAAARVWRRLLGPYGAFAFVLRRFDVLHTFFDGGFLAGTPLRFVEVQLVHLAGKTVVVMPYGSDVAVPSRIASLSWRHGLALSYPHLARRERATLRQIRYFCRRADFVVACIFHLETLPRWDMVTTHYYPIDTDRWRPPPVELEHGEVVVAHTPNHRSLKGTEFLVAACDELHAEGLPIRLLLLEGLPNEEVRVALERCDVVAEQFLHGYALSAIEGMSLGKPVLSNLSDPRYYDVLRLYCGLDECPIVDTPVERIKDNLRTLVEDPVLRRELGEAGRRYVLDFHSYESVARMWELVYRRVWHGEDVAIGAWRPTAAGTQRDAGAEG